jgi:hypothetical protein
MAKNKNKWTLEAYITHNEALLKERDKRYFEVAIEKEKAIRIKEVGDDKALNLAREIQTYKDEKANELRTQIDRERGTYATHADLTALSDKFDVTLKPILTYVTAQSGGPRAITTQMLIGWGGTLILILAFWYSYGSKMVTPVPTPVTIVQPSK